MQDLNDMAYFAEVVDQGSFAAAARTLGLPKSRLSRRVAELEARLGVRLLARTTRRVGLTEEGSRMLDGVRRGLDTLGSAINALDDHRDRPTGRVRITLPRMAFARLFAEHIPGFAERYPEIGLEFALDDGLSDIVAAGFDAGVRFAGNIEQHHTAAMTQSPTGAARAKQLGSAFGWQQTWRAERNRHCLEWLLIRTN